jgi:hypothetical protein
VSDSTVLDPISPELALVSPELAREARGRLPAPGFPFWEYRASAGLAEGPARRVRLGSRLRSPRAKREPMPALPVDSFASGSPWPPARSIPPVWLVLVLFLTVIVLRPGSSPDRPHLEAAKTADVVRARTARPAETRKPARKARTIPAAVRAKPKAPARRKAGHALAWPRLATATYYDVQVFRGSTKVFEAWPDEPSIELPRSWVHEGRRRTLAPGVYEWYVWPGFGVRSEARYGDLLRRGTVAVPTKS